MAAYSEAKQEIVRDGRQIQTYGAISDQKPLLDTPPRDNLITDGQAIMHLMKGMIGTGILAIPSAFKYSGLWVGFVGLIIFGIICTHCMNLLVKCSVALTERLQIGKLDYTGVVREGLSNGPQSLRKFTNAAVFALNTFLCLTQYGFCCVYILFVGDNIHQIVTKQTGFDTLPLQAYQAFATLLLMAVIYIKELKHLAPISIMANILCFVGLVIILQYCVRGLQPISNFPAFSSWSKVPLYFGTAVYAFEGIGVVLPIESKMQNPRQFRGPFGILNTGMIILTCLYTSVGFYGYMKNYPDIHGSITIDLPNDNWLYVSVKIMFTIAIFCTYPLQFFVPHNMVWPALQSFITRFSCCATPRYYQEYLFKLTIVSITFVVAAVIPHLNLMISLIGALASTAIAMIFPAMMDLVIFLPHGQLRSWEVIKDILLFIFAFIGFVAGTGTAIYNIIQEF